MATTLRSQKVALRKAMRGLLANLPSDEIQAQSHQITRTLLALPEFQQSKNISCFLSMPAGEVDTSAVVDAIIASGKNLYVPKTTDKEHGIMDFFRIFGEDDLRTLPRGLWGIREPEPEYMGRQRPTALSGSSEPLDLIVMPGVAFDRSLSRLGYGKGYYDRFLASYADVLRGRQQLRPRLGEFRIATLFYLSTWCERLLILDIVACSSRLSLPLSTVAVAVALREQILEAGQVPVGETDWRVDVIVGPDGIVS